MRRLRVKLAIGVAVLGVVVTATAAVAGDRHRSGFETSLSGYEEVPASRRRAAGRSRPRISRTATRSATSCASATSSGASTQAHIHFEQRTTTAAIVVFLCSNLAATPPAGTQACPAEGGTIRGHDHARERGRRRGRRRASPPASSTSS